MNVSKRKILMFRCIAEPSIGPKPRQAFSKQELSSWDFELTPVGVYVRLPVRINNVETFAEHLVPFANIQTIKFAPEEEGYVREKLDDNSNASIRK